MQHLVKRSKNHRVPMLITYRFHFFDYWGSNFQVDDVFILFWKFINHTLHSSNFISLSCTL